MSRVHDALRKAEQLSGGNRPEDFRPVEDLDPEPESDTAQATQLIEHENHLLSLVEEIPFTPAEEAHLISLDSPQEMPAEEFRSLRTRLNHLQTQQQLRTIGVTSASPAEGKTFTALNLALAQTQLSQTPVLIADLDLRRPSVHRMLQIERGTGFSDYVLGAAPLEKCMRRIAGSNLFVMPAGSELRNPLEVLGAPEVKSMIMEQFPRLFKWTVIDTPPLLFSADANFIATLTDGTLIVVRIGETTYDSIVRAMQSLCENNVLGIVVNGARASELYSKYTYYYSRHD